MTPIDAGTLAAERHRFFLATRGAVVFPTIGTLLWLSLGGAGFLLSPRAWCAAVLVLAALITPAAIILFRKLVARLEIKSSLATLILPALLPVALSLGTALAAFSTDPSLVPLVIVIGLASHWPAVGWMFDTPIYWLHSVVRVALAVALWFLLPDGRFTWLPLSIGGVYAATALLVWRELHRAESGSR